MLDDLEALVLHSRRSVVDVVRHAAVTREPAIVIPLAALRRSLIGGHLLVVVVISHVDH